MKRMLIILPVLLLILAGIGHSGDKVTPRIENLPLIGGNEPLSIEPSQPWEPGLVTDSPGEVVGTTQYDYQTNGSTGNRIALDSQGGVHLAWMNGITYPSVRHVYYNYADAAGNWMVPGEGQQVSQASGAGYTQIGVTGDDRAAIAYHQWQQSPYVIFAIDAFPGFGIFDYYDPPDEVGAGLFWPYMAVDRNDNIHIVMTEATGLGEPQQVGYTRSTDGGDSWEPVTVVDTVTVISANVVASPVSDKVAIIYTHPTDIASQWYNDIFYIESEDGIDWDWRFGKINVTHYGAPDSTFAYTDLAAVYDYNDNLHIIWTTNWLTDEGRYFEATMHHYDTGSETISEVIHSPSEWLLTGCETGAWNLNIAKMSLGFDHGDRIFTVYTAFFDTSDCSAAGYANGELYMQYSTDGGQSWEEPWNLTESNTPGCESGDCDSDHWSSLADRIDDYLHIIFIEDKDAGGIPQDEGIATTNPVKYLKYPNPCGLGVLNNRALPTTFALSQNYPNPFNASTNIDIELNLDSHVELSVYDITGAEVATLVDDHLPAGSHSINWEASDISSGVYFYTLKSNGERATRRMTLLK